MSPKWPFGGSQSTDDTQDLSSTSDIQEQNSTTMTDSAAKTNDPVLTFEGKRYDLRTLPDELKELRINATKAEEYYERLLRQVA